MQRLGDDWEFEMRRLPRDWNSYGARPITDEAIDTLKRVFVVPANDGGLQIEIHENGIDCEAVIRANGQWESFSIMRQEPKR